MQSHACLGGEERAGTASECYRVLEQAFNVTSDSHGKAQGTPQQGREALLVRIRYCNLNPANVQSICSNIITARKYGIADGSPVSVADGAILLCAYLQALLRR